MVRLLECQNEYRTAKLKEDLKSFAICLLCHMLEIYESDLSASEMQDLDFFIKGWVND